MIAAFNNDLVISPHRQTPNLFYVRESFRFYIHGWPYGAGAYVEVTKGALTNGASVPWLFTFMFPRWHPHYSLAAALHDALVGEFGQGKALIYREGNYHPRETDWDEAAELFGLAMQLSNTPRWLRKTFYHAVMLNKRIKRLFMFFRVFIDRRKKFFILIH